MLSTGILININWGHVHTHPSVFLLSTMPTELPPVSALFKDVKLDGATRTSTNEENFGKMRPQSSETNSTS